MELTIDNRKVVTPFEDEDIIHIIKSMLESGDEEYGHYALERVPEDEVDCYSWDEEDQKTINQMEPGDELYILKNGIGDFEQPLGVVLVKEEEKEEEPRLKYTKESKIETLDDIKEFLRHIIVDLGIAFHPDDDPSFYQDENADFFFTKEESDIVDKLTDQCFDVAKANGDADFVYDTALDFLTEGEYR